MTANWTWIFQAKPVEWDLRRQLAEQPRAQWKVSALRPELRPYVRHPKYLDEIKRAGLLVEQVIRPELARATLIEHPEFALLAPIGGPTAARQGTNFSVSPEPAALLARLIEGR